MLKYLFIIIFLLLPVMSEAAYIYTDADCGDGITVYNPAGDACTGGSDTSYSTIQGAITNCEVGDKIYVRAGTYNEYDIDIPESKNGTAWTEGNYTTLSSYPGEWAIIIATGGGNVPIIRHVVGLTTTGSNPTSYWKFERLELDGNGEGRWGMFFSRGPIWVRYCYIHDLLYNGSGDDLMAGIWVNNGAENIIEYNYFKDNTATSPTANCRNISFSADYKDDTSNGGDGGEFTLALAAHSNIVRYNYCYGSAEGIAPKAQQRFGYNNRNPNTMTYKTYGNVFHHNIVLGTTYASMAPNCDFDQVYNNITDSTIESSANKHKPIIYNICVYNNTVISSDNSFYLTSGLNTDGDTVRTNYYDAGAQQTVHPHSWHLNNISDGTGSGYHEQPFILSWDMPADSSNPDTDWADMVVDRNLIHDADLSDAFLVGRLIEGGGCDNFYRTVAEFNVCSEDWRSVSDVDNWDNDTAGLFLGGGGANDYITDGTFIVSGATTIAGGGIGGSHPYLDGVTLPSYIGATNPSDNDWVDGVLTDLASTTWLRSMSTDRDVNDEPTWIEGGEAVALTPSFSGGTITGGL